MTPACYQFELFPEYKEYTTMKWYYEKQKFPQNLFQPHVGGSDAKVMIHGRQYINYSTYNYLALGFDDRVKQAAMKAVDDFGVGTGSGRSITGEIDIHSTFEKEICDVLGTEDAVLSVGGYSTNAFTIGYLCRNQDLILYDELIHNSALIGCKITGARRIAFPHNDYDALSNPAVPPLIWLRHLSVQVLCEVHRKQFRGIRSPYREENQFDKFLVASLTHSSTSLASKLEKADLQSKIVAKLSELNQIDREVLEMRHVDGYSLAEIAKLLDIQLETIKKRYYRALRRFKDLIGPT